MIVVDKVGVVIIHLVGAAAVDLQVVTSGINLGNRWLHRQGVDLVQQRGVAAAQ